MPTGVINRRHAIAASLAASIAAPAAAAAPTDPAVATSGLGLVIYCCGIRRRWVRMRDSVDLFQPRRFLSHCSQLGAGGAQVPLGVLDAKEANAIREFAARSNLFVEASVRPPRDQADARRFEAEISTAAAAGALAARTVIMSGRRYEQFRTLEQFREGEKNGRRMLELAAPIVEKHKLPLAVENHKDQRLDERIQLLRHIDSEFVGACVDTGNSLALLDDPYDVVDALAPFAFTVHLKDQALQPYADGFLLADIPLGQGSLDLSRIVASLRRKKPDIRFALELITRDPLKVPCLTAEYWATMPSVKAAALAQALRLARDRRIETLQQVRSLPVVEQLGLEDENVKLSLAFARKTLKI